MQAMADITDVIKKAAGKTRGISVMTINRARRDSMTNEIIRLFLSDSDFDPTKQDVIYPAEHAVHPAVRVRNKAEPDAADHEDGRGSVAGPGRIITPLSKARADASASRPLNFFMYMENSR